jgi:hypothetical protein
MSLKLALPTPSTLPVVPAVAAVNKTVSALTVQYYLEEPEKHMLSAKFAEVPKLMMIFSGAEYDSKATNWTDADVVAKVKTLFPN